MFSDGLPKHSAMTIHIKPLNQCPHHIDALARALYTEWHDFAPWSDMRKILDRYHHALTAAGPLPKVWMAENGRGALLGSASLKEYDLRHYPEERYWLGDVFVMPEHRGCGAGGALVKNLFAGGAAVGNRQTLSLHPRHAAALRPLRLAGNRQTPSERRNGFGNGAGFISLLHIRLYKKPV